ncbi:formate dehydrogenase accessory sulfurtransferase FdhD [Pararhodobacter sp.]|uniref:formate dehydrogenase accessory sulfurtransferase FdhD n=1 Tax=Pararhodobacter sp. TaxID=2127056 RepID=UPI002AFEC1B3|nr:formate dehydrogenase accessory sulfurtransferase FdhD [Pararhodobacter sp.]
MLGARSVPRLTFGAAIAAGERVLPEEVGVALTFNGTTQAVMMATPDNLADFATGFALTEGLARPEEIESITVVELDRGLDVQVWVTPAAEARLKDRRRTMAGPVGCGLCGIDSLEQALRDVPPIRHSGFTMTPAQIKAAVAALPGQQTLHDATRAVHCAAWWTDGRLTHAREDVGRHNALDKLAGAMVRASTHPTVAPTVGCVLARTDPGRGAIVLTSRVSIDLVQKVATLGAPILIAVSSPTADAVTLAETLGITLIAQARADCFDVYTHTDRIATETEHVR